MHTWRDEFTQFLPFPSGDFWVFGYGSLIWNPNFMHARAECATLEGYHRALCIWAWHYRGTQEKPGLVFGLDEGGQCEGRAFHVNRHFRDEVLECLWKREMITHVYKPAMVHLRMQDKEVEALTFVADPDSEQYAGKLSLQATIDIVSTASGSRGTNREYVEQTHQSLQHLDIEDPELASLCAELQLSAA